MNLHPTIPNHALPSVLKKKLKFGDREQLDALDELEEKLNCKTTERAYLVTASLSTTFVTPATDQKDAKQKALRKIEEMVEDGDIVIQIKLLSK